MFDAACVKVPKECGEWLADQAVQDLMVSRVQSDGLALKVYGEGREDREFADIQERQVSIDCYCM